MNNFKTIVILIMIPFIAATGLKAQNKSEKDMQDLICGGSEYVIFQHEVADFNEWNKIYVKDEQVRNNAGLKEMLVLQGSENPNEVTLVFECIDKNTVDEFISNPDLAQKMQKAGVIGKPVITFFKTDKSGIPTHNAYMLVKHKVQDYNIWREGFDKDEATRKDYHLSLVAVGKDADVEGNVIVLLNADNTTNILSFLQNSGLKEKMEKVGVISEPEIDIMNQYINQFTLKE